MSKIAVKHNTVITTKTIIMGSIPPCTVINKGPTGVLGCEFPLRVERSLVGVSFSLLAGRCVRRGVSFFCSCVSMRSG